MFAFDRDGVLVGTNGAEVKLIVPVVEKIADPCVVISNQRGIMRGYVPLEIVVAQFEWLMGKVPTIKACFFCPDNGESCYVVGDKQQHPVGLHKGRYSQGEYTNFRKPNPGMAELAKLYGFPITHYVGDLSGNPDYAEGRDSDRRFAENAGVSYLDVKEFLK